MLIKINRTSLRKTDSSFLVNATRILYIDVDDRQLTIKYDTSEQQEYTFHNERELEQAVLKLSCLQ